MDVRAALGSLTVFLVLVLAAVFQPAAALAQEETGLGAAGYDDERVETLATMYLEIEEVRDELHAELARWHEAGRRQAARAQADEQLEEIHRRHGVTPAEYEAFIRLISTDQEARDAFMEVVARKREEG